MKIAIYTGLFINKDEKVYREPFSLLKIPKVVNGYDFIPFMGQGSRLASRRIKCLPHKYLSEYDVSIWIDSCIRITAPENIIFVIEKYLKDVDLAVLSHPAKDLSISSEVERCKTFHKGDPKKMDEQIAFYKKCGCPDTQEVIATTVMIRRHNTPKMIQFDEAWWDQIQRFSIRDQISFPYLVWKTKIKYNKIYSTHPLTGTLGIIGTDWFERSLF